MTSRPTTNRQTTPPLTRGTVFREAAVQRMVDAKTLLEAGRFGGAIYLAGYAVECHLKYSYCSLKEETYLPKPLETHSWDTLLENAGLKRFLEQQKTMEALYAASSEAWTTSLRYSSRRLRPLEATRLYNEMKQLYGFLKELVP